MSDKHMTTRLIRTISLRLQRVLFTTLTGYFGLTTGLFKTENFSHEQNDEKSNVDRDDKDEAVQMDKRIANALGIEVKDMPLSAVTTRNHQSSKSDENESVEDTKFVKKVMYLNEGSEIISPGDPPVLYVVLEGRVDVFIGKTKSFSVQRGNSVGWLSVLTGEHNMISARVYGKRCVVVRFSCSVCEQLLARHPSFAQYLTKRLLHRITPLIHQVDTAMGWRFLRSGQVLIRKGDPTTSLNIILSGRLRAMTPQRSQFGREWGRGMSVGEQEVILNLPSPHTVRAVRDSEIAVITSEVLLAIGQQRPSAIYGFLKYVN